MLHVTVRTKSKKRNNVTWNTATDGAVKLLLLLMLRLHHVRLPRDGKHVNEAYVLVELIIFTAEYAKSDYSPFVCSSFLH